MNFDTTDYASDDLGQADVNVYMKKAHSLRSEAISSYSCSFCVAVKDRLTAIMNSWML
jgi:hypothetical protein